MANEPAKDQNTPNPQGSDVEGGDKLLAGKYKSVEELERGYKELETGYHQNRQELREIRELVETRLPQRDEYQTGYGQGGDYSRGQSSQTDDSRTQQEVLTRFYQNPLGVLTAVKEEAKREISEEFTRAQRLQQRNSEAISRWSSKNQDIVGDEVAQRLLTSFVAETDGRLSPESRLDQAADKVRRVLASKKAPGNREPNPGDHIESPTGEGSGNYSPPKQTPQPQDMESHLRSYMAERRAARGPKKPSQR